MKKILVVGDPHSTPEVSNDRFEWLGHLIVEEKPETIVCVGDFGDFASLALFDVGKKSFEGKYLNEDFEAVVDAQQRMFKPIDKYNNTLREKKVKLYKPRMVMLGGNHDEARINRAINSDSKLYGSFSIEDCKYEDFGWEYSPFKEIIEVDGINFTHYFTTGLMDRPISGTNVGQTILSKVHGNALQGHNHILSLAWSTLPSGKRIIGGSVGCYFNHKVDYVTPRNQAEWARGILILNVEDKEVQDYSWISLKTIERRYV